jgi:hypothetical protein
VTEPELSKFDAVVEKRRLAKLAREAKAAPPVFADEFIPEAQYERSEESNEIDRILAGISIVDAYARWCGKMKPSVRPGQKESIMVSCPQPGHRDSNPSAWLNVEKNVWNCAACNTGGDMFDIAANHFGVSDYKSTTNFPELRRSMVKDLGYVVEKSKSPGVPDVAYLPVLVEPAPAPVVEPSVSPPVAALHAVPELATVTEITDEHDLLDDLFIAPTFEDTYMGLTILDDAAEEYHFWNGILAISLAAGRAKKLSDGRPVHGNLLTCIIGRSGDRKSRSIEHLTNLIELAIPYNSDIHSGAMLMQGVASGEQLISMFDGTIRDVAGKPIGQGSVTGLIEYPELSDLTSRALRPGNTLKSTLHQLADTKTLVGTSSRTGGRLTAVNPYACLTTTTQPDSLKGLLQENDTKSGFLNRFVFVTGKPKRHVAIGGINVDMTAAVDPLKRINGQPDRIITWERTAQTLFEQHFYEKLEPAQQADEMLARIDLLTKKLILLFALNEGLNEINGAVVEKAIYLFDYLCSVYRLTGERVLGKHQNAEIYEELIRHIKNLTPKYGKFGPSKKNVKDRIKRKGWDPKIVEQMFEIIKSDENVSTNMGDTSKPGRNAEHFQWIGATG